MENPSALKDYSLLRGDQIMFYYKIITVSRDSIRCENK